MSYVNGLPKDEIAQGRIGSKLEPGETPNKYLYDAYLYDSPIESKNIKTNIDQVVVYGKIPRNSIRIPTITGGSFSPDFMYVIKKVDGSNNLNVVLESKGLEHEDELRGIEKVKIDIAKKFFEQLSTDGYDVTFTTQFKSVEIKSIIDSLL